MKPINLKEFKEKREEAKVNEDYRRRYFSLSSRDQKLYDLIFEKIRLCEKLSKFMGQMADPYDCLTFLEFEQYRRITNFLMKGVKR